jgi:hypothetical protein
MLNLREKHVTIRQNSERYDPAFRYIRWSFLLNFRNIAGINGGLPGLSDYLDKQFLNIIEYCKTRGHDKGWIGRVGYPVFSVVIKSEKMPDGQISSFRLLDFGSYSSVSECCDVILLNYSSSDDSRQ